MFRAEYITNVLLLSLPSLIFHLFKAITLTSTLVRTKGHMLDSIGLMRGEYMFATAEAFAMRGVCLMMSVLNALGVP